MRFKSSLCRVACLVITVALHSATAQYVTPLEVMVNHSNERMEKIMEKLQLHLDAELRKHQLIAKAQHNELIEKLAAHKTTVIHLVDESMKELHNIAESLLAGQSDILHRLTNVENQLDRCSRSGAIPSIEDRFNLGDGWTVFQRRDCGEVDFYRNWTMYKHGFGDANGEQWLGLEKLHALTSSARHELLVLLEDHDGNTAHAQYDSFTVAGEAEGYKYTVGRYSGTAGDSLTNDSGMKFSTFDNDNDSASGSCAQWTTGAWWFGNCYQSHLNGKYFRKGEIPQHGVVWYSWKGFDYSLKSTKMMVRPYSMDNE